MKIHVYPGMGATSAMYSGPWLETHDYNLLFHDWPDYNGVIGIDSLAKHLIQVHRIAAGDIIIGSSLGGIVACEIANQLNIRQLILVGSAVNKAEINKLLALLHPLIDLAPLDFIRRSAGKVPADLTRMFKSSDAGFIRAMCKAIFTWDGLKTETSRFRIHGIQDRVIPCPAVVDVTLPGGHLIAMSHAKACVRAVRKSMEGIEIPLE